MNQLTKLMSFPDMGREVWKVFDRDAGVYELFTSEEGSDYIGCADTLSKALEVAKKWAEDLMSY